MEEIDRAAVKYLHELLSEDNQVKISDALRAYKGSESERLEDFQKILQKKIFEKQQR
jgi:hypothetical protein